MPLYTSLDEAGRSNPVRPSFPVLHYGGVPPAGKVGTLSRIAHSLNGTEGKEEDGEWGEKPSLFGGRVSRRKLSQLGRRRKLQILSQRREVNFLFPRGRSDAPFHSSSFLFMILSSLDLIFVPGTGDSSPSPSFPISAPTDRPTPTPLFAFEVDK